MDSDRRSGSGCLVLAYYDKIQEIWGGSPSVNALTSGVSTQPPDPEYYEEKKINDKDCDDVTNENHGESAQKTIELD